MDRVVKFVKSNILISAFIVLGLASIGASAYLSTSSNVKTVVNSNNQLTQISYSGKNGVNAFALLKEHAKVTGKQYSFGYFVESIDGVTGNGPKYWTLYDNGKESNVGASDLITKNSDTITWKLQ